jgi:peroxiredoxin
MTKVASTMLALGAAAPDFALPNPRAGNRLVRLDEVAKGAKAVLVAFLANHCPYSKHILHRFAGMVKQLQPRGLAVAAISASDVSQYPEDSPERMEQLAESVGFTFPFLYDETQDVARTYQAACTPDFFLFDSDMRLVYRGRFDASMPGNNAPVTGEDLIRAVSAVLDGKPVPQDQLPSIGCSIKWKPSYEPAYAAR